MSMALGALEIQSYVLQDHAQQFFAIRIGYGRSLPYMAQVSTESL
jgi:hypothetical protein